MNLIEYLPVFAIVITAIVAVVQIKIKSSKDRKTELMKLAVQTSIEAFKTERLQKTIEEKPLSFYLYFHYNFLHLLEQNKATPSKVKKINEQQAELLKVVTEKKDDGSNIYLG